MTDSYLIRGGTVADAIETRTGDLGIADGKIVAVDDLPSGAIEILSLIHI